jgi:hypothetical protein
MNFSVGEVLKSGLNKEWSSKLRQHSEYNEKLQAQLNSTIDERFKAATLLLKDRDSKSFSISGKKVSDFQTRFIFIHI